MRHLFLLFLLIGSLQLSAQIDSLSRYASTRIYASVGLGLFPLADPFSAEVSAALGYRFNRFASLGLEYRASTVATISTSNSASLFGLNLRGQLDNGFAASVGLGFVVDALIGDDGFDQFEYFAGGQYMSTDWGYQFRSGLTLGVYVTAVQGQSFEVQEYNFDTDMLEPSDRTIEEYFMGGGVKVGFAFPGRRRR